MAFGPMEALGVALGAAFRPWIWAATCWPFKKVGDLIRKGRTPQSQRSAHPPEPGAQIIDVTPVSSRFREELSDLINRPLRRQKLSDLTRRFFARASEAKPLTVAEEALHQAKPGRSRGTGQAGLDQGFRHLPADLVGKLLIKHLTRLRGRSAEEGVASSPHRLLGIERLLEPIGGGVPEHQRRAFII